MKAVRLRLGDVAAILLVLAVGGYLTFSIYERPALSERLQILILAQR